MRRPGWLGSVGPPTAGSQARPTSQRDRLAMLLALVTIFCLGAMFFLSKGPAFLMPGPLTSAHAAITNCGGCHARSGSGKLSWAHGLISGDRLADSKACLTCHKMPETAFNAHSAPAEVLERSTERLTKIAAGTPQPQSTWAQGIAFPTHDVVSVGLSCATCHQEHQGGNFKLNQISNAQCQSCHVVKFDSFDGHHPKFDTYPFKRRTRIVYDHASHFSKHFPEVAKKEPSKRIPATCSTCHNSSSDKRVMAVAPFEQTCAACHLDQISGKGRVSGPKGIAFLSLPGLDLQSLKKKNAAIGEWPDASDAVLTPFMKVMISRNERGRDLIKSVESLTLQDLSNASGEQITAVTALVWEIKALFHALISGKAPDALGDLNLGGGGKLSAALVADLTASMPRDVVVSAQQQWLPNLATEMANGQGTSDPKQSSADAGTKEPAVITETAATGTASRASDRESEPDARPETQKGEPTVAVSEAEATKAKLDPPACNVRVFGQCLQFKAQANEAEAVQQLGASEKQTPAARELPRAMRAGLSDVGPPAKPEAPARDQSDELLFPTEAELREIKARTKDSATAAAPAGAPADAAHKPQTNNAPAISIEGDTDPESWAEYGGWYRQDYGIFYRPAGHEDKFIYAWLTLTGPQAPRGSTSPAAAVFDFLTSKDAQGACTKCHSVDDLPGKGRVVNFSQPTAETKRGSFTTFVHQPHFSTLENGGCLTCHAIEKGSPYLKSYEQGNPQSFASNFAAVKKDICQSCHTSSKARQDCLLCHKYHVNGAISPIMKTKNPTQ